MPITTFIDPSKLPNRSQPKPDFDKAMADFFRTLPIYAADLNGLVGEIDGLMAGGAYAFRYLFDSATSAVDPGVGKLRLSSTIQNTSNALRIDNAMSGGTDLSAVWADLLGVASAVKGSLRIVKSSDPSKWMIFDVTGSTAATGYRNLSVSVRASSEASPFANGDPLMVYIQRAGDISSGAQVKLAEVTISSPVALINFLSVFRADCDKYVVELQGITPGSGDSLAIRMAVAGVAQTASNYFSGGSTSTMTASSRFGLSGTISSNAMGASSAWTIEFRNTNAPANTTVSMRGISGAANGGINNEGFFNTTLPTSGFQIFANSGSNISAGTVRVYGILN